MQSNHKCWECALLERMRNWSWKKKNRNVQNDRWAWAVRSILIPWSFKNSLKPWKRCSAETLMRLGTFVSICCEKLSVFTLVLFCPSETHWHFIALSQSDRHRWQFVVWKNPGDICVELWLYCFCIFHLWIFLCCWLLSKESDVIWSARDFRKNLTLCQSGWRMLLNWTAKLHHLQENRVILHD